VQLIFLIVRFAVPAYESVITLGWICTCVSIGVFVAPLSVMISQFFPSPKREIHFGDNLDRVIYILFSVWTYRARDYRWVCALACVRAHTRMYVLFHFWQINSLKLAWSRRFLKIQVFTNSLNTITLLKYGYSTTRSKQTLIVNIIRFIIIQLTIL